MFSLLCISVYLDDGHDDSAICRARHAFKMGYALAWLDAGCSKMALAASLHTRLIRSLHVLAQGFHH